MSATGDGRRDPVLRVSGLSCAYGPVRTLLSSLAGLVPPVEGNVTVDGHRLSGRRPEEAVRRGVALVPEGRLVFGSMSVRDNLLLGAYRLRRDGKAVREGLDEIFATFPPLELLADRPASLLSGGEQQMLAIGRALMARPRLLMLDEPSLGLAPRIVRDLMHLIGGLAREGRAVLLVEQLARVALEVADRGYLFESGRSVLAGTSAELRADDRVREIYMGVRDAN
jgi:branched-chain amino acid transport system ATP-binding protein